MSKQHMPQELVAETLSRVPIKDLIRFQCVSKAWRDLICDRSFVEKYRNTSRGKFVGFYEKGLCLLDMEADTDTAGTEPWNIECPFEEMVDESVCVLHCHGMLCLTLKNQGLAVWHPYSKEFKIIPNPGIHRESNILGFGYDRFSDDYKIVTFVDKIDSSTVYIFEFESNSWRESIRIPCPDWHYRDRKGIFLDRNLYWMAYRSSQDRFVLCYNLTTHEYQKLSLPVNSQGTRSSWLGIMGKNLCLTEFEPLNQEITISVMEKTDAQPGSWNKVTTVSTSCMISSAPDNYDYFIDFVSLTKNNNIILTLTGDFAGYFDGSRGYERTKKKAFLYRIRDRKFEQVRFRDSLTGLRLVERYVESPVVNRIFI
ncbi:PREDICTED: putative F-box protein At3g16210 [Tarenaya hassleriana]|uniref:putative F-box protein At3g16210 n=1 Tax=Tarenaya hassleriana TaxID=28532 RepID=UPI00053C6BB9|nr:PREDICTED: putative F-box protein At3g16210 [Tarenaya hassleriana]